ncbi:glycosyltransferase family 2 protein [Novosphingobium beihaiensis]|uniref:Glycosyltransferase n=1 Tax=Novosphingobium beihaiensis TaxID=2930389 RepID=A0ABT0BTL9_9SPHN|nr:glycosyltransferase family 2 protein [Novosphingobium beihaiensis]MCJ2188379.1 glycosyltransferase [Novosphingobium beihaiensis]
MLDSRTSVAVIIPAFNAGATIARTLRSVLAQSLVPDEVVIVDDGSTDDTLIRIQAFAPHFPQLTVTSQANAGPASARNCAIRLTDSAFVAPIDADDVWHPDYLQACVSALRTNPHVGLAYAWHHLIDMEDRVLRGPMPFTVEGEALGPMLLTNFVGNGSSAVYRRQAIEDAGFYQPPTRRSHGGEDYLLQLRIAAEWQVACVQRDLVGYRKAWGSLSSDCRDALTTRLAAIRIALNESGPCRFPVERWVRGDAQRTLAVRLLGQGDWSESMRTAARALASDTPAFLFDFGLRVRNLALRRIAGHAPVDRPLDRLLLWRLRLLTGRLARGGTVPYPLESQWALPYDPAPAFDAPDSLPAVVPQPGQV